MNNPDPWQGTDVIGQATLPLQVPLTDEEQRHRGRELALQLRAVDALKQTQRAAMNKLKREQRAAMAAATQEVGRLKDAVTDGSEERPVVCVHLADFAKGICTTVRADTSETVGVRRLTQDEAQVQIATPLRVVPGPGGKLQRADGRSVQTLPFVQADQCAPLSCRECDAPKGSQHAPECPEAAPGDGRWVSVDQCDPRVCLDCDAPIGERHATECPHYRAD